MVFETPPQALASSTTCGSAGSPTSACPVRTAARAAGSFSLPPGYEGPLPEGGFHAAFAHDRCSLLGRAFMTRTTTLRRPSTQIKGS